MSLYADYIHERLGDEIIETKYGFATYRYPVGYPDSVYIIDIYVKPEKRKMGYAKKLADKIAVEAKKKGYTKMIGSVSLSSKDPEESIKVLLAYGMHPMSSLTEYVLFSKNIK